ncbi:MAG: hypothetical protein U5L01_16315 [Rheinheimera sp.]|nr:hypothetical protein [Rheinheimera sp.]
MAKANPVAVSMLGEPLIGQRWLDIVNRSFRPRSDDGLEVSLHDGRQVKSAIYLAESVSKAINCADRFDGNSAITKPLISSAAFIWTWQNDVRH